MSVSWRSLACLAAGTASLALGFASPLAAQVLQLDGSGKAGTSNAGTSTGGDEIRRGPVLARIESRSRPVASGLTASQPVVRVLLNGRPVGELVGAERIGSGGADALLQVAELDPSNPHPEVLLSSFTGGAHCCNRTQVLSSDATGDTWRQVSLGDLNGGPHAASDPIGSGRFVLVDADNRFLYLFASYAGSRAPARIWQLQGDRFLDVSHHRDYLPLHRRRLQEMADWFKESHQGEEVNGFLAAYVANKALVGEFEDGWQRMLQRYDRRSSWGLKQCTAGYDEVGRCRAAERVFGSYPEALRAFLVQTGYIGGR